MSAPVGYLDEATLRKWTARKYGHAKHTPPGTVRYRVEFACGASDTRQLAPDAPGFEGWLVDIVTGTAYDARTGRSPSGAQITGRER